MIDPVIIEQGGNDPILFEFDESIGTPTSVSVYLMSGDWRFFQNGTLLKSWTISDVTVADKSISCPITQAESAAFTAGDAYIELKLMKNSEVILFEHVPAIIGGRNDKAVTLS